MMAEPEVVRDDEEIRFVRDVELLRTGEPLSEVTDASYQADLAMANLLIRARFVPTAEFKARLRSKLQNQLEIERRHSMLLFFSNSLFRQLFRAAVAFSLAASLVLVTVLIVSPAARAQVQDLIVRFVEVDSPWALLSAPSGDAESPGAALPRPDAESPGAALPRPDSAPPTDAGVSAGEPRPSDIPAPPQPEGRASPSEQTLVSLEEAQAQTSFTIKMPATLPEGYSFKGVLKPPPPPKIEEPLPADSPVSHLPSAVTLIFEDAAGEVLMLSEMKLVTPAALAEADRAAPSLGEIKLPAGVGSVQEVTVNGQPGQYIEGAWSSQGWDSNASHHLLHWQGADGVTYSLLSRTLGLSELLATAESIP
jgi:hypothetical protein